jgi:ABC-type branched-subunit amino acid transport system substrate-binding protein
MKRRSVLKLGLTAAAVAAGVVGVKTLRQGGSGDGGAIKIASILTLTGPAGQIGQEILNGQKLAVEYWNTKPGAKVELVAEDSKNQPKDGLSAFQSLKARGFKLFTTNGSGVSMAIKPEIRPEESLLLAMAAHPGLTNPVQPGVFRYSNTATDEARTLVEWIKASGLKQTVLVFHSADDYGAAFAKGLEESLQPLGLKVVLKDYRKEDVPQMKSLVQAALPKEPYLPIVVGVGQPMAQAIAALRTLEYKGPILTNVGYALTGVAQQLGAQAGKIVFLTLDVTKTADFGWAEQEYKKKFGKDISADAAIGFNAVSLIVSMVRTLKNDDTSKYNQQFIDKANIYLNSEKSSSGHEILVRVRTNAT